MSEEPTEFDRAEFDKIRRELTQDTFRAIGQCITGWAKTESFLVTITAMLLGSGLEKTGLILYSINNFHTWLSIIEELFALDPQFSPLRPDWIAISNRLKKHNDIRVSLAHHALDPGKGFEHFVETDNDDLSGIIPTLKPHRTDMRSRKSTGPSGLKRWESF
jgi:hypothetical protein